MLLRALAYSIVSVALCAQTIEVVPTRVMMDEPASF